MDCLNNMEIALVELTGAVLFREEKFHEGGIMSYEVYAIYAELGTIVFRKHGSRHKKLTLRWIKEHITKILTESPKFSRTERIKLLIKEIKIKKVLWKYKITEEMYKEILKSLELSKEIYDNENNSGEFI